MKAENRDPHTMRTVESTVEVHASRAVQRQHSKFSLVSVLKWRKHVLQPTKRGAMNGDQGKEKIGLGHSARQTVPGTLHVFIYCAPL